MFVCAVKAGAHREQGCGEPGTGWDAAREEQPHPRGAVGAASQAGLCCCKSLMWVAPRQDLESRVSAT